MLRLACGLLLYRALGPFVRFGEERWQQPDSAIRLADEWAVRVER